MTAMTHMNRIYPFLFINLGICMSVMPLVSAQSSFIDRIQNAESSIVTIEAQKQEAAERGAGVIIDPAGYIVTNTHTILYAQFIFVTLHDGTRLPASVVSIAPNSDFAILKLETSIPLKALPWADSQTVQLDDEIMAIGNSTLWKETISGGKINSIGRPQLGTGQTIELLGMDLNLDHGDSGGPILDRNGNFLGIIVAKNTHKDRLSYAIPSNVIREHFLKNIHENHR